MTLLSIAGVHAFYGQIAALKGVDLEIGADEVVALIGANGAGKSTLLMTICGRPQAAQGRIALAGTGRELLANSEVRAAYLEGGR